MRWGRPIAWAALAVGFALCVGCSSSGKTGANGSGGGGGTSGSSGTHSRWFAYTADEHPADSGKVHWDAYAVDLSSPTLARTLLSTDRPADGFVNGLWFSPDSRLLAYETASMLGVAESLSLVDMSGAAPKPGAAVAVPGVFLELAFSPDSKTLAAAFRQGGTATVYAFDVSGPSPAPPVILEPNVAGYDVRFFWITNDLLLYQPYEDRTTATLRYVKRAGNGFGTPQTLSIPGSSGQVAVTPRPNPLSASVAAYEGAPPSYVDFDTGQAVQFTTSWGGVRFSGDLNYVVTYDDSADISVYPSTDASPAAKIASFPISNTPGINPGTSSCSPVAWSNKGATLVYADPTGKLRAATFGGGSPPSPAAIGGGYDRACNATFSPDDRWLFLSDELGNRYLARNQNNTIADATDFGTLRDAATASGDPSDMLVEFAPDATALLYKDPTATVHEFELKLMGLVGNQPDAPRTIETFTENQAAVFWAPDASWLVLTQGSDAAHVSQFSVLDWRNANAKPRVVVPHPDCKASAEVCSNISFYQFQP